MPGHDESKPACGIEFYGGYQVYDENGIDLTLLGANLGRTIERRWEDNRRGSAFFHELGEAGRAQSGLPPAQRRPPAIDASALVARLMGGQVEFVIVGGIAMRALGAAHVTYDLDICCRRIPSNLRALVAALAPLHPQLLAAQSGGLLCFDVLALEAGQNLALTTDHGDLDLLATVHGVGDYDRVLAQSVELEKDGQKVRVLSIDGLIAAKTAAGRNKDRNHLLELEALKKLRDAGPIPPP